MLAAFLTTVLFSISAVCGNRTAKLLGGTEANFWRLCFAAMGNAHSTARAEMAGAEGASPGKRWRKAWPWVLLNGLAGPALGVSCFQWALKTTPTGVVLPIVAITPLVIIPFSYHLEGERPTRRSLAGGALAVLAAAALAWVTNQPR